MVRIAVALLLLLPQISFARLLFPELAYDSESKASDFHWSSVKPSKELVYHECFVKFKCARLLVPLDWQAPEHARFNKTISLAIIKLPAKVPITHPKFGGPVLTNPGGPGGSGISEVLTAGEFLQYALDSHSKHFDIVAFDPRGVGHSGPDTSCFTNPLQRDLFGIRSDDEGNLDGGDWILPMKWARAKALGQSCANTGIGEYVSTASVARDMLEIVERIEENHQRELYEVESASQGSNSQLQSPMLAKSHGTANLSMLQYIGFSYGTFLGNTFASMFPDRVHRMILDAVVDAPDYIAQGWSTNLQDTDKILPALHKYCFEAGAQCPLYNKSGPEAIQRVVDDFLENLKEHPVAIVDKSGVLPPAILTYSELRRIIFMVLYNPGDVFPILALVIAQMLKGEFDQMLPQLTLDGYVHCPLCAYNTSYDIPIGNEAHYAIACGDGDDKSNETLAEFKHYLELLESQSSVAGALWAELRLGCMKWPARPKWRFTGPFRGNTSTPILWIGNTADPVTPLQNAYNMAEGYPDSVVLQQDSEGHSALLNAPGECTFGIVREYFSSGKLPKTGTICPPARKAFDGQLPIRQEYFTNEKVLKAPRWKVPFRHLD